MTTTAKTTIQYSHTIGSLSNQGRGFQNPVDLAINSQGLIYVLNRAGPEIPLRLPYKRISICTIDQQYLGEFGTGGTEPGQFWWPCALTFDPHDRLYVTDEALNRITIFSENGETLTTWGHPGTAPGQLNRPSGIAADPDGNLLIADSGNHRIQKFAPNGQHLQTWSGFGRDSGRLNTPWGLALDPDGNIYAADWGNHRIQKFAPDGQYLTQFPPPGAPIPDPDRLSRPAGVSVDADGIIYVADWGNERVRVLSPHGETLATLRGESQTPEWANDYFQANPEEAALRLEANLSPEINLPGGYGTTKDREQSANIEKLFWGPTSVKLDHRGNLLIADSCRHRLQVYRRTG